MKSSLPRILIVDDSKGMRHVVQRYLSEKVKAVFKMAADGAEAETSLQSAQLDGAPIDVVNSY